MNTYILFWNPSISSCTMEEYQVKLMKIEYDSFNWSVYEHEGAKNSIARRIVLSRIEDALSIRHLKHIDEETLKMLNENLEALHSFGE